MTISHLPPAPLSRSGRRLAQTFATAPLSARSASYSSQRAYWSWRCGKAKYPEKSPYQYWASYPTLLRSRYRQLRKDLPKSTSSAKDDVAEDTREADIQAEEQRFYDEFQKLSKQQWREHMELLKQAIERDPYTALFGMRHRRGVWNPFDMEWPGWKDEGNAARRTSERDAKPRPVNSAQDEPSVIEVPPATSADTNTVSHGKQTQTESSPTFRGPPKDTDKPEPQASGPVEVYLDLITMKKVVRTRPSPEATRLPAEPSTQTTPIPTVTAQKPTSPPKAATPTAVETPKGKAVDIPVKPFKPIKLDGIESSKNGYKAKAPLAGFASQSWLQKEGFSQPKEGQQSTKYVPGPPTKEPSPAPKTTHLPSTKDMSSTQPSSNQQLPKFESSLNRITEKKHLESTPTQPETPSPRNRLEYNPTENREEDVDLLRASDIRAAAGRPRVNTETLSAHQLTSRRQELYTKFIESQRQFERELKEEIISALKHHSAPMKSPLWSLWMLYDHEARKDWAKWAKEKKFTLRGHEEFEQMQYMSKAFKSQMPTPAEIFKSGGSSLGRYLDANRVSMILKDFKAFMNTWHLELQTILSRRGAQPFSDEVLEDLRKALLKYHRELRQQILSGYGATSPAKTKTNAENAKLFVNTPTVEMRSYRDAMRRFEERTGSDSSSAPAADTKWTKWTPPGLSTDSTRPKRPKKDRDLYQAVKKVYDENRDAFHPISVTSKTVPAAEKMKSNETLAHETVVSQDWLPTNIEASVVESTTREKPVSSGSTFMPKDGKDIPSPKPPADDTLDSKAVSTSLKAKVPETSQANQQTTNTIVLKVGGKDGDVKVHEIMAPKMASVFSNKKPLNTSESVGFQKVLDFMRQTHTSSLLPVMRLDSTLNSMGYLLARHSPDMLVYQKPAATGSSAGDSVLSHTEPVDDSAQPRSHYSTAPESIESLITGRAGTSVDEFQSKGSVPQSPPPAEDTASESHQPQEPLPSAPEHSTSTTQAYPESRPLRGEILKLHNAPNPSQPIRRSEPVFSGQNARHQRHRHSRRQHVQFSGSRRLRRFLRGLGRAAYVAGLFLLGAYMIGLGVEWGRHRDEQRQEALRAQREEIELLRQQIERSGAPSTGRRITRREERRRAAAEAQARRDETDSQQYQASEFNMQEFRPRRQ